MFHFFVAACFTAFFMAIISQYLTLRLMKAPISLLLSGLALMRYFDWLDLLVLIPAVAFVAVIFLELTEKVSTYRSVIPTAIRREP